MRGFSILLAASLLGAGTIAVLAQDQPPPAAAPVAPATPSPAGPPAVFTDAQAVLGQQIYQGQCAACHGAMLEGTSAPALQGQGFAAMVAAQGMNAESLLAITSQTMPQGTPGTLTPEQYAAVAAFILQQNGYPSGPDNLTADNPHLKEITFGK